MKLQVLVATTNQQDNSIIDKMNIKTDAIIVNQSNENGYEEILKDNKKIQIYTFSERGVGLNRNTSLMRADADICLFSDDDVIYVDDYEEIVLKAFSENPEADMILFNVPSLNEKRPTYIITKNGRVRKHNCLKYGAVKMAIRLDRVRQKNIYFSLLFGGGAKYSSGEDSLFIYECLDKGLKIYTNTATIGYVKQEDSTWFRGYNEKFFYDKGVFFYHLNPRLSKILVIQFVIRKRNVYKNNMGVFKAIKYAFKGINDLKRKRLI